MTNKDEQPKKMQTIGLLLLTILFGGWLYYQSWQTSKRAESLPDNLPPAAQVPETKLSDFSRGELRLAAVEDSDNIVASDLKASEAQLESAAALRPEAKPIVVETDVYRAELSSDGAVMRSLILTRHDNGKQPLEMVRSVASGLYPFTVYLGDYNDGVAILLPFRHQRLGELAHRFNTEFTLGDDHEPYILEKTFEFARSEYMVKVSMRLQRKSGAPLALNRQRVIYSLYYGPQIGPEVDHIGKNRTSADMRNYVYYNGKKSKTVSLSRSSRDKRLDSSPIWAGISGKYFGVFGLPSRNLDVYWSEADVPGLGLDATGKSLQSSQFLFVRHAAQRGDKLAADLADDTFYYYIGPLLADDLAIFNKSSDNEFGLADAGLSSLVRFSLGFIEEPVKWILNWLRGFTANYGIAIILFALIVRLLLYPLTLKSYKSTSRMRLLQPQLKELQEKYKSDPKRLQQEMATFYRKEGVNPLGGCLPLLIQMPILIAIANLFYRYFELRGAIFIPGWIDDLSAPDLLYTWQLGSWELPLRLLPIIYLGSQLLSSKLMQASQPPMQSKMQQRMFTLYMPILFSIILYNMPSGLILYWTISNLLMMVQQLLMVKFYLNDATESKRKTDLNPKDSRNYTRHISTRGPVAGKIKKEGHKNSGRRKK